MSEIRKQEDFLEEIGVQLHLLEKSAHEFDQGDIHEIRNMARALRIIFDGDQHGNSSLVELAGWDTKLLHDSGMDVHQRSFAPYFRLAGIVISDRTIGCRAFLGDSPVRSSVTVKEWLDQCVIGDKCGAQFNRLRLIKAVANLGGGTHYPPNIREYFVKLQSMGVNAICKGRNIEQKYIDVEKHSIRQIAHEVLISYKTGYARRAQFEDGPL